MTESRPLRAEVAVAAAAAALLTLLTFRGGLLLTFDGYYYVELAKQFASDWPDRFGNHWPFGFPLLGSLLVRFGVRAYQALLAVSSLACVAWLALFARLLPARPHRWLLLLAVACAPALAPQWGGVLAELPFAAALLGLAFSFSRWPSRRALAASALCALLALGLRYAGVIAFAAFTAWGLVQWRQLRRAGRLGDALLAWGAACAVAFALLAVNVAKSGYASGAARGHPAGLADLPAEFSAFGWSIPSALVAGGIRDRFDLGGPLGFAVGGAFSAALLALCVWRWLHPPSSFTRPLALVAFGYVTGMMVLHCIGDFDALYNARTFFPALAPGALLLAEGAPARRPWLLLGAAGLIAAGLIAAGRGLSREIGGNVAGALAPLRREIARRDGIAINDHAFALAGYFPQPVSRTTPAAWREHPTERFLVIAAEPRDRQGGGGLVPPDWAEAGADAVRAGRYRYLVETPGLLVLEAAPSAGTAR